MMWPSFEPSDAHLRRTGWEARCELVVACERSPRKTKLNQHSRGISKMRTIMKAGWAWIGACALAAGAAAGTAVPADAEELSEKSVRVIMDYAWAMIPQQFTNIDGKTIVIDKAKREQVEVPLEMAREIIRVGRVSAHAQICNLPDDQAVNHRSMMRRETDKKSWSDQQLLYINQLHLTTVMLLTGKIKVVEKEGDKEVVVDEGKVPTAQTCTPEQSAKIKEMIKQYVDAGPKLNIVTGAGAAAAAAAPAAAAAAAAAAEKK